MVMTEPTGPLGDRLCHALRTDSCVDVLPLGLVAAARPAELAARLATASTLVLADQPTTHRPEFTTRLLAAAGLARVEHLVAQSSAAVYDPVSDWDVVDESSPLTCTDCPDAWAERQLDAHLAAHPFVRIARIRHAPLAAEVVDRPARGRPAGDAPVQTVDEDDLVRALARAVRQGSDGPFNIASQEVVTGLDVAEALGTERFAFRPRPRVLLEVDRAVRVLGWRPWHTTLDTLVRELCTPRTPVTPA